MDDQSHPLYATDRDTVDRLLTAQEPSDEDLVDAARLLMRYEGFPGASDLQDDLAKVLRLWSMDRQTLHRHTRVLWSRGYRPGLAPAADAVGSGFDTANQDTP